MPLLLIPAVLAVLAGVALGLLGGGGSILTVPILVYTAKLPTHQAIATSLFVVGTTSLAALIPHARAGRVRYQIGALFGAASMVGAFAAGRFAKLVPPAVLLVGFGLMMAVTAVAMMRKAAPQAGPDGAEAEARPHVLWKILLEGLIVGAVTGLVGAGGGFLVVPALVLLAGLSMREAVGTSLMVIAMKSFAGFAGYMSSVHIDWTVALLVAVAAVLGSFVGAGLVSRVPAGALRKGFAWFVVAMAVFILAQEVPRLAGVSFGEAEWWAIVGALVLPALGGLAITVARTLRRRVDTAAPALAPVSPDRSY